MTKPSSLETFRAHAREMATAEHTAECACLVTDHWRVTKQVRPDPTCPGCVTADERALWKQLADEIDAYLTVQDSPLWEGA